MPVPAEHSGRYLYHFTHVDNLPGMLRTGILANTHPAFPAGRRSIAAAEIQARRADMVVTCGPGGRVHDYVPLYFGALSPMLTAVLLKKNVDQRDIAYLEFPIALLDRPEVVFTDAAANTAVPPGFYSDPASLDQLDWDAIDARTWTEHDPARKNRRMAEALVHRHLAVTEAVRIIGFDDDARRRIAAFGIGAASQLPSVAAENSYDRPHYLRTFDGTKRSFVAGPQEIRERFEDACAQVEAARSHPRGPIAHASPAQLLVALRADFGCIPHTAELVGLVSANGMHRRTVDIHTCEVAERLRTLPAFVALPPRDQELVELAAYLHDIGKGPKARWAKYGGVQQTDTNHPVGAMPMMVEIMTHHLRAVPSDYGRRLLKLVCYHDLAGDILGRGRDEQQLIDVVEDALDIDMLVALGQADASVLQEAWAGTFVADAAALRDRCARAIQ